MKKLIIPTLLLATFYSCTKSADLGDFDIEKWKSDPNGCNGVRVEMIEDLLKLKPNLLGLYQKRSSKRWVSLKAKSFTNEAKPITFITLTHQVNVIMRASKTQEC